ncbi:TIGR02680 family protein [Nocardia sp. NPDC057663]|uniref:TIGR02680 family protein n=1 Tax=Nocardia sp. NPDC057663 TaxID=3346201 RepID=UPI00366FA0D8
MNALAMKHFEDRWRLSRAGMVNVWHYIDTEFTMSGGRLILRGSNGSGKSRALEMLLPFLLDADRRRMDATGSQKVSLDELMHTGIGSQTNRVGYLWLELSRPGEYLTLGAHIKYSASARRSEVRFFTTDRRVGDDLILIGDSRDPLPREKLIELVGAGRVGDADHHREAVRTKVFGLHGETGRDRFTGLMQLLHTLRSPDVGNRIDEGKLPQILSDALPPLSEQMLDAAGERLDDLSETRYAQQRLSETLEHVRAFHQVYQRYTATTLSAGAVTVESCLAAVDTAEAARAEADGEVGTLAKCATTVAEKISEHDEERRTLVGAIDVLRERPEFADAEKLQLRDDRLVLLRSTAETALNAAQSARSAEQQAADGMTAQIDKVADTVGKAAELLGTAKDRLIASRLGLGELPDVISCDRESAPAPTATIQDSLDGPPVSIARPVLHAVTVDPPDPRLVSDTAARCGEAAFQRGQVVERRTDEAHRLDRDLGRVNDQEDRAERAVHVAEERRAAANADADARDELAISLNQRWRKWVSASETARLMLGVTWPAVIRDVLASDDEALCGDADPDDAVLSELSSTAERAAGQTKEMLALRRQTLTNDQRADDSRREEVAKRRADLEAERDPEPPYGPWHREHSGVPLCAAVDFQPQVTPVERAGIEAALLASGLLTATVTADATVRATDGEVLLAGSAAVCGSPISAVLRPDPAAKVSTGVVEAVLSRIGLHDPESAASIGTDGSWRNGVLAGRHSQPTARYIGAAARAAARASELEQIAAQLVELETAERHRASLIVDIDEHRTALDAHLVTAPRTLELELKRQAARTSETEATKAEADALAQRKAATAARQVWSAEFQTHSQLCESADLPVAADALASIGKLCTGAREACRELERAIADTVEAVSQLSDLPSRFAKAGDARIAAENEAERRRSEWVTEAAEIAARHAALDLTVEELTNELKLSTAALKSTENKLNELRGRETDTARRLAVAERDRAESAATVKRRHSELRAATAAYDARLRLPGLAAAASAVSVERIDDITDLDRIREVVRAARAAWKVAKPADLNMLIAGLKRFEAGVSGQLDVATSVESDAYLVHIEGAEEHHDCTSVLTYLTERDEQGRAALSERERQVFTEFVLGGVADELRRRVDQADELMKAMDKSLSGTRTSHGIGVSIAWALDTTDPELRRAMDLIRIDGDIRDEDSDEELVRLIRRRVEQLHAADSSAGYVTHLRAALDYRAWHAVQVTILGPDLGQRRQISRRAKISQGETRFVSYVALFVAADGFLSGLPESDRALRLVLLDDAFAKVDERAIGELMGLLVRLDIDFVMTGHALWGTVPEVPALDIYEIRRIGGSAVIPTWIQWNGRNKTYMQMVPSA